MRFDNIMRKLRGQNWIDYKNNKAVETAEKAMRKSDL